MRIRFTYTKYPYSEKATKLSRALGGFTHWIFILLYSTFIYILLAFLLPFLDMYILYAFSVIITWLIVKLVKKKLQEKIEQIAKEDYINHLQK